MWDRNIIFLTGNVNGESKYLPGDGGKPNRLRFSLITGKKWKDKQTGEERSTRTSHMCVVRGALADALQEKIKHGDRIDIQGEQINTWDDENKRAYSTVYVGQLQKISEGQKPSAQVPAMADGGDNFGFDDDFPF